jgi:hypothetical protein
MVRVILSTDISLEELKKLLDEFCQLHINPLISGNFRWQIDGGSLYDRLSSETREQMNEKFFTHLHEFTREKWFWAPLNSVSGSNYEGANLILADLPYAPNKSDAEIAEFLKRISLLEKSVKYVAIRARSTEHAKEKLGIFLGALFLCMYSGTHYAHTMGKPASGLLRFEGGMTFFSSRAHLPYLAHRIEIADTDLSLLARVESLLQGGPENRKIIRSLRWLSASWPTSGAERFSLICQAVDALTPSNMNSMSAKCNWIYEQISGAANQAAIEMLFKKIRSDVAHGDAPSLIESRTYLEFLLKYGVDPELAAVEIARRVLVDRFVPEAVIRPHPANADTEFITQQTTTFARFGMEYSLPTGFDFSKLCV